MILSKKGQTLYSCFVLLTEFHQFPTPKLTNFLIFITLLSLNVTLFSKSPLSD